MATKLIKSVEREIKVPGIEWPVILTVSTNGLAFRVKGTKKATQVGWGVVIDASMTPENVPSFLYGKPFAFLQHQAQEKQHGHS